MTGLFDAIATPEMDMPLAEAMRPRSIEEVTGQDHLLGPDAPIGRMLASRRLRSMVLWGPPGTGKTTIARLLADACAMRTRTLHASTMGIADLRSAFTEAEMHRSGGRRTCLVVDEIHRMSRPLQDQLLAPMESGLVTLVACTTEHVAYELVDAMLSRLSIHILRPHDHASMDGILMRIERMLDRELPLQPDARNALISAANGDARRLIGFVEDVLGCEGGRTLAPDDLTAVIGVTAWRSDKDRDLHYDRASAMQKSVRASDPDAALYWFAQMLEAGEDMEFVMRRLLIMANEDVGLADPQALVHCIAACEGYARLGPKAGIHLLAQAIAHLATCPKSNAVHHALDAARALVRRTGDRDPNPISINHPTADVARTRGYVDDHATENAFAGQDHWPGSLPRRGLYHASGRGSEATILKRMDHWKAIRETL